MSHRLYRLGRACFRAPKRVLAAWLLLLALVGAMLGVFGSNLDESFSIPGTPAQVALDDLERTFPQTAAGAAQIVVHDESGKVTDPATTEQVTQALTTIAGFDGVAVVSDPYTGETVVPPGSQEQQPPEAPDVVQAERVSDDGSTLYAQVQFDADAKEVPDDLKHEIEAAMAGVDEKPGTEVDYGGEVWAESGPHMSPVELVGILVALVMLAFVFRSLVAAFLPIGTAIVGVGVALGALLLVSNVIDVPTSAQSLGMMIGLAVGIDYALFIVSRFRELLGEGKTSGEAAARATASAGGAVVFAGATVVIALAGLSIARIPFLTVMGLGAAFAVVVAVAIALTLLPALLALTGE